jgi:hypothetical protein
VESSTTTISPSTAKEIRAVVRSFLLAALGVRMTIMEMQSEWLKAER